MEIKKIKYKDWYLNQDYIPTVDVDGEEVVDEFYAFHEDLCRNGFWLGGVYFPGYLYWHLNFWKTEVDGEPDIHGKPTQSYMNPLLRDNEWIIFNSIYLGEKVGKGVNIFGSRRISKDLLNSSLLYTPTGEITIGESKVGQKIFDDKGDLTTIIGVYPQGVRPVYKMTLQDGRELFCGLDHNWSVIERAQSKKGGVHKTFNREVVKTTKELIEAGVSRKRKHNGYKDGKTHEVNETKYWIRNSEAVKYGKKDLPIDPYFVGLYLEDESKSRQYLKDLGVFTERFIPKEYLHSSVEQRMSLLQGLMDSNGSINKNGSGIYFSTSFEQLADDFCFLIRSLGITAKKVKREGACKKNEVSDDCKDVFEISIYTDKPVFRLKRKLNRAQKNKKSFQQKLTKTGIVSIEYVFDAETTCIEVDNEQKLFLTDNFTITHNTTSLASYFGHGGTFDKESQNVLAGLDSTDIRILTDALDKGLNHLPEHWQWQKFGSWDKQITLGVEDDKRRRYPFSRYMIRNLDGGNKQERIAGTKPRKLLIDECGKGFFAKGLTAALPGFTTSTGFLACSPLVVGTSGDVLVVDDAMKLFENPKSLDFLEFPNEENPDKPTGLFMGAKYRLEAKDPWKLGDYLLAHKEDPLIKMITNVDWDKFNLKELNEIEIMVSNEEKAFKITDEKIEQRRLNGDIELYLKEKMYYPKKREDLFLKLSTNFYNKEAIKARQEYLKKVGITGIPIELYHDGEKIRWKNSEKQIITEYPVKTQSKDAPILIYEFPEEEVPQWGMYVSGADPYRQSGNSIYSNSLGALVVYKRTKNIVGDGWRNTVVATYTARPDNKDHWNEQARYLIRFYNAYTLVENDEYSFIDYMKQKGDALRYLAPQPAWLKAVTPYTSQNRDFGVSRSGEKTREFLDGLTKKELDEIIHKEYDEEGNLINEVLGVTKHNDMMLLEEIRLYEDGVNADRYVAYQLALALARDLDNMEGTNKDDRDKITVIEKYNTIRKKSNSTLFGKKAKNNLLRPIKRK